MKISKGSPIVQLTRRVLGQKGLMKAIPKMFRLGGWIFMLFYKIIGMNVLLLTTNGRRSGKARTTPAMYIKRNQDLFIAAIPPENRKYPNWYYNIVADPDVSVELFWRKHRYTAEPVNEKSEKLELISAFPLGMIEAMHQNPPEEIPVIRLKPVVS